MQVENAPSAVESPQGRRVLVAVVDGEPGERIKRWRLEHDPVQAERIPPHSTLCYWVTGIDTEQLGRQVRHAFSEAPTVRLTGVREFEDSQGAFYVGIEETAALNECRRRLYDGSFVDLGDLREWPWHITCVRDSRGRDVAAIRSAAGGLDAGREWRVSRIACLELRGDRYEAVKAWEIA